MTFFHMNYVNKSGEVVYVVYHGYDLEVAKMQARFFAEYDEEKTKTRFNGEDVFVLRAVKDTGKCGFVAFCTIN